MVTTQDEIIIPLSKAKLTLMIIGAVIFVALGVLFIITPETFVSPVMRNEKFIFVAGLVSISFSGIIGFYLLRKLLDDRPGLVISKKGIYDNSSGVSAGLIDWNDIVDTRILKIQGQKILLINVKNPDIYIQRQKSKIKRLAMITNHKYYGTPISITANGLKISFDKLYKILTEKISDNQH